jgi:hypothetical protein
MNQPTKIKLSKIFLGIFTYFFLCFIFILFSNRTEILSIDLVIIDILVYSGLFSIFLCPLFSFLAICFNRDNKDLQIVFAFSLIPLLWFFIELGNTNFGGF